MLELTDDIIERTAKAAGHGAMSYNTDEYQKAVAMKNYGDAARQQMELDTIKVYFEQLPKIASAIGDGYANVESIKMFGNDSAQLAGNIMSTMTQVTDGIKESTGLDVNAFLAGLFGNKVANINHNCE